MTRRFTCGMALTALLATSATAMGYSTPPLIEQVDFPDLAIGETAIVRIKVPTYLKQAGRYQIYAMRLIDYASSGFQVLSIDCGHPEFEGSTWPSYEYAGCIRRSNGPHDAFTILVAVHNASAPAGKIVLPEARVTTDGDVANRSWFRLQSQGGGDVTAPGWVTARGWIKSARSPTSPLYAVGLPADCA